MMVTETETLTSTLHHHKFTYLDNYVFFFFFSATFIQSDFIPIYFHTVFSEKQIPNTILHNI